MPDHDQHLRTDNLVADIRRHSVRGGVITSGAQGVKVVVQFGAVVILARLLTPEAFGLIAMVAALGGVLDLVKEFGLSAATIQRADITHAQVTMLFWINAAVGAAIALLLVTGAPVIAQFYHQPALVAVTRWLALGFLVSGLTTQHWALLRRQMRFSAIAALETSSEIVGFAVGIAIALVGGGYWALVAQRLAVPFLALIGSWTLCRWRPGRPRLSTPVGELVRFGVSITGCNLVGTLSRGVDQVLIGWLFGPVSLGLYERAAKLLVAPINNINAPLYAVAMPALSRLIGQSERYRKAHHEIFEKLAMATMPTGVLVAVMAGWVVSVLFGPHWADATPLVACFAIAASYYPVTLAVGLLYMTQNRSREMLRAAGLDAAISVLLMVAGLPFGVVGVAGFYAFGGLIIRAPLAFWLATRRGSVTIGDLYRAILPSIWAALAVGSVGMLGRQLAGPALTTPVVGMIGAAAAGAGILTFAAIPQSRHALFALSRIATLARPGKPVLRT
jgi:polysaccharide transporter, PST family